jgi:hypothetical protein
MSTVTLSYPNAVRQQRVPVNRLVLILVSLVLIASTILVIVLSADADLTDRVPVSQNSIAAIPVPTPPTAEVQPIPSETPAPFSEQMSEPPVVAVPVPTP